MIRLVALDIDGTLIEPGVPTDALPDDAITQAVQDLQRAGVTVILATGRMYPGTAYIAKHLNIDQPLICQQGASVHNQDGSLLWGCTIDHEIALELFEYAAKHGWSLAWFDSQRYLVTAASSQAQYFADVSQVVMEVEPDPQHSDIIPTGIDIVSTVEHSKDIHVFLEAAYGPRVTLLDFPSVTAIHAPQASKGNAISKLAQALNIDRQEVLAIGDSVNDVSMLTWAGSSATPAHCDRYARDAANEVLAGPGVSGVARKLSSILPT